MNIPFSRVLFFLETGLPVQLSPVLQVQVAPSQVMFPVQLSQSSRMTPAIDNDRLVRVS